MGNTSRILAVSLLLGLVACVYQQTGNRFDADAVKQLQPGVSTEQDAIAKLGQPMSVSNDPSGNQLLLWQYYYGTAIGVGGGALAAILFGADGKMIRVQQQSQQ